MEEFIKFKISPEKEYIMQTLLSEKDRQQESRIQIQVDESPIHRLGGTPTPKKNVQKQPLIHTTNNDQLSISFSQSNPFYQVHKALQKGSLRIQQKQKCFQDVLTEVHEMKQICSKLLNSKVVQSAECPQTLIMDLQDLQTKRANLEEIDNPKIESQLSIKDHFQQEFNFCGQHDKCNPVNEILLQALKRIQDLTESSERLEKNLKEEANLKQSAQQQNAFLRAQIARIDEEKCDEIKRLRRQIQKVRRNQQSTNWHAPLIFQIGRVPTENCSQKFIREIKQVKVFKQVKQQIVIVKQTQKPRPPLVNLPQKVNLLSSDKVTSIKQVISHQTSIEDKIPKLRHIVYL